MQIEGGACHLCVLLGEISVLSSGGLYWYVKNIFMFGKASLNAPPLRFSFVILWRRVETIRSWCIVVGSRIGVGSRIVQMLLRVVLDKFIGGNEKKKIKKLYHRLCLIVT